ncbi:hypothetical protein Amsp01_088170 [Amycolatopsis sp. NBRC 101858]|uniref:GAF domain-containing SpoIIE family protein phosphatase n=1 Tax=Amycolatopsis sp. NBRC 101858 TaxID=3032200 RepID=UPI0024A562EC|nr:SpoIIE family protein phosphatase [Amycolatopsis sp. NBRC 101858]GLY42794.1 hypothetical protein Amsp01_088170 [Amycolatopsis sp. NBRC 101858]
MRAETDGPSVLEQPSPPVRDPDRVAAVHESGLSAAPDVTMDRFAAMVCVQLQVPVALVSLVESGRQIFPGMQGLPEPWATDRQTPLARSFCQHIVASGEPLILDDARLSPLVRDNLAVPDLGVVAYAGMPLTTVDGQVLGSLCAIDTQPREWTGNELAGLADMAAMCTTELRLRLATRQGTHEQQHVRAVSSLLQRSHDRDQLLLSAAQALAGARTLDEIRHQVAGLVSGEHTPSYVGLVVTEEDGRLRRVADRGRPTPADLGAFETYSIDAPLGTAKAIRERRMLCYPDPASVAEDFPPATVALYRDMDLHSLVCAPLVGTHSVLGCLAIGWNAPHGLDAAERAVITLIATYTAQALERVRHLERRVSVARELQEAMLTQLPEVPGLTMAARYLPSATDEAVGGDWYDAILLPGDGALAVTVGDIVGHDVHASTLMGQVRSMLRQAAWSLPAAGPAETLQALETALAGLSVPAAGTLVHAHLHRLDDGGWRMTYTNAGHPPPIVLRPDGSLLVSREHDMLFGYPDMLEQPRVDQHLDLEPGSLVFLYTDGLVERRGADLDAAFTGLSRLVQRMADQPAEFVVDTVVSRLLDPARQEDDVVVLAIRT